MAPPRNDQFAEGGKKGAAPAARRGPKEGKGKGEAQPPDLSGEQAFVERDLWLAQETKLHTEWLLAHVWNKLEEIVSLSSLQLSATKWPNCLSRKGKPAAKGGTLTMKAGGGAKGAPSRKSTWS